MPDEKVREQVVRFFASFDETIKGFEITRFPQQDDSKDEYFKIDALHKMIGSNELAKIPLQKSAWKGWSNSILEDNRVF